MPTSPAALRIAIATLLVLPLGAPTNATEYGFSTYRLGSNAFGAGATPPPGTYVTALTGFYSADIGSAVNFGNVVINAGAKFEGFTTGVNLLYVPDSKLFGGNVGLSITVPGGHVDVKATVGIGPLATSREVDGWGFGDMVAKAQLGWQRGDFAHTLYVQAVAPTGRWEPGFSPIVGLHRPGVDTGWAFTWTDRPTKLQFNGALGVTFNFENSETDYKSGHEFHFEWAIGRELSPGLVLGLVGYDYRQLTGDSGSGANLGSFKGQVDAIGAGLSYTTLIHKQPFVFSLRHYREFNAENHWEGDLTVASGTLRF